MKYTKEFFITKFENADENRLNGKTTSIAKNGTQAIEGFLGGYESNQYSALRTILGIEPYALVGVLGCTLYQSYGDTSKERILNYLKTNTV